MANQTGSEPVAAPEEVFLVYGVQHSSGRSLDDLVLACRDMDFIMHLVQLGFGDGEAMRDELATQSRSL